MTKLVAAAHHHWSFSDGYPVGNPHVTRFPVNATRAASTMGTTQAENEFIALGCIRVIDVLVDCFMADALTRQVVFHSSGNDLWGPANFESVEYVGPDDFIL
jgi:hypothetical protein